MPRATPIAACALVLLRARDAAAQDLPQTDDLVRLLGFVRPLGVFLSVFVVLGSNFLLRFITDTAARIAERFPTRRLLAQKAESILRFALYVTVALTVLGLSFEINTETLQLVALVFGFGIGLATKDVAASVIAGVTIIFDRPFQVGDRVTYAGEYGDIIKIGLRSVRMCTLDDNIVTIPNNKILTEVTSSGNYGALDMQVAVDFFVGADQDLEVAERIVREAMLTSRYVFLDKPVVVLVSQDIVADMVVVRLRAKGYVLDVRYEKAFQTDVCKRVLAAFPRYGVLPPASFERAARAEVSSLPTAPPP
ncbi:MAG: mechanosensitive ion channel domain-containing protein [Myxococcota bacterium]